MSDYIPSELIPNILARLQVADVLRCTSVCKSWYVLITSSSFISLHLKLSPPNQEPRILVKSVAQSNGMEVHCKVHSDNEEFDEIAELNFPFDADFKIIGSTNGLFCLSTSMYYNKKILLWNPSLRKSLKLPEPNLHKSGAIRGFPVFGFGFLPETNDYKIVMLLLSTQYCNFIQVDIYELSTNSWRNVSVDQVSYFPLGFKPAVFHKDSHHWVVRTCHINDGSRDFGKSILLFDLKNENVKAVSVPNCLDNDVSDIDVSVVEESLCLIYSTNTHHQIWVMKEYGVPDSWTMQYSINVEGLEASRILYFRENGEIIIDNSIGETLLQQGWVSYNLTSNRVMNIGEYENNSEYCVATYMESLTLIKSSNQVL